VNRRSRIARFVVSLALALAALAVSLGGFLSQPPPFENFYPTLRRDSLPGGNPIQAFVTPLAPETLRRDPELARIQSELVGNRFPPGGELYLIVRGHGFARRIDGLHFALEPRADRRWQAVLVADTDASAADPDPPLFQIGVIARIGAPERGHHQMEVRLPAGGIEGKLQVAFEVTPAAEALPQGFLSRSDFFQRALRSPSTEVRRYLLTHALPVALGLPGYHLETTEPMALWPHDRASVSTRGFPWGDEGWFVEGLVGLAGGAERTSHRLWASFALAYLSLDRSGWRERLVEVARSAKGQEAARILAATGDLGALPLLVFSLGREAAEVKAAEESLALLAAAIDVAGEGRAVQAALGAAAWNDAARIWREGAPGSGSRSIPGPLSDLAALGVPASNEFVSALADRGTEAELIRFARRLAQRPVQVDRTAAFLLLREASNPAARADLMRMLNSGGPPGAAAGPVIAAWLGHEGTRRYDRAGLRFLRETAIALDRIARPEDAAVLSAVLSDDAADLSSRIALALILCRVADASHKPALQRFLERARAAGRSDLGVLEQAIQAIGQ